MIGRVYRGGQVGGLLRYLYGPGRHNEHDNPHLVGAWDLTTAAELATLEPPILAGAGARAMRDFTQMTGSLELATAFRPLTDKAAARVVWHCPLRTAPGDRRLTDAEWAEVARDVMHRTGIAERGDDGGCRWVAVRHDEVSVHLVAVLARQDGEAVRIGNDYRHLREACREAEQRLGLGGTAPADLTADRHTTRAEVEKAARKGLIPDRDWLREQVQVAALTSTGPAEFVGRLRAAGVVVRERTNRDGQLTGYAVGRPAGPGEKQVLFGGGKLAPDLSLPQLTARWTSAPAAKPEGAPPLPRRQGVAAELTTVLALRAEPGRRLRTVSRALEQVTESIRSAVDDAAAQDGDATVDLLRASGDAFRAVGLLLDARVARPVREAAHDVDRATRSRGARPVAPTPCGQELRRSATRLLALDPAVLRAMGASPDVVRLLVELQRLAETVRDLRAAQQRLAQAQAAARGAQGVERTLARVRQATLPELASRLAIAAGAAASPSSRTVERRGRHQ